MSLLLLLAAAKAAAPTQPTDPPSQWPATTDATLLALRPGGRTLITRRVGGSGATDATIAAACDAVKAAQDGQPGYLNLTEFVGPDHLGAVLLAPGTLNEVSGTGAYVALVGTDPAARTIIESTSQAADGILHPYGSFYAENLHLRPLTNPVDNSAPKYCIHLGPGQMSTIANSTLDLSGIAAGTLTGAAGIAGWVGADGTTGQWITFYQCDFIGSTGVPGANGFNLHGHDVTVFDGCTGLDSTELHVPSPGTLYVLNTPCAGVKGQAGDHIYVTPGTTVLPGNAATIHEATSWPIPAAHGLPSDWDAYYYPSAIGTGAIHDIAVTDAAAMAPVPGRTYVMRVPITSANRVTHARVNITTAAGQIALYHSPADTPYERNLPAPPASLAPATAATAGIMERQHYYAYTRYPGDHGFWVQFAADNASLRVEGSAELPGLTDCYYTDDGTTLTQVNAGTRFPVLRLRGT